MNPKQEGQRIILEAQRGRIRLCLTAAFMGRDLCVTLSGGDRPHIGAVALAGPRTPASALNLPRHREGDLARQMAEQLSAEFGIAVCIACGVHLDAILEHEIKAVLEMAEELTEALSLRLEGLSYGDGEKP
jgi:hypothetical protein